MGWGERSDEHKKLLPLMTSSEYAKSPIKMEMISKGFHDHEENDTSHMQQIGGQAT